MVWESETDGNPSVDADESISPNEELTEPQNKSIIPNPFFSKDMLVQDCYLLAAGVNANN
jgi:hypothetical protein